MEVSLTQCYKKNKKKNKEGHELFAITVVCFNLRLKQHTKRERSNRVTLSILDKVTTTIPWQLLIAGFMGDKGVLVKWNELWKGAMAW